MKEAHLWRKILSHIVLFRWSNFNEQFCIYFSISHFQQIASVAHGTWIVCRRSFIFAKRPREVNVSLRNDAKPDKSSLCWNSYFVAGHLCTQLETVNFLFKTIFEIFQKVRWVSSQFFLLRVFELIRPMLILLSLRVHQALIQVFQNFWPWILLTYYVLKSGQSKKGQKNF